MALASPPSASTGAEFGLVGGEETAWAYLIRAEPPDDTELVHFAFMPLGERDTRFLPLQQDATGSAPARAAVRRARLHAIFADGTHLSYAPVARRVAPEKNTFYELKLPESCVPPALTGDDAHDALYAVVPRRIAGFLERVPTTAPVAATQPVPRAAADPVAGLQLRAADDHAAASFPEPTTKPVGPGYCLVRYERGAWWRDREIPPFFDDQTGCLLAVMNGVYDLYFTRSGNESTTYFVRGEDDEWSAVEPVSAVAWSELLACGIAEGQPIAIVNRGDQIAVVTRHADRWIETARINSPLQEGWATPDRAALASVAGSTVVLAWAGAEGGLRAGAWDLSGEAVVEAAAVEALAPRPRAPVSQQTFKALPYAVLALIMLGAFIRRRRGPAAPVELRADQAPASHGRRLLAFVLDAMITAPALVSIMSGWLKYVEHGDTLEVNLKTAMADFPWELSWRWMVALAVYVAYCILFEALRGATPGKLLARCRVVSEDGERCTFGAIVVRNVLRCVEFFPGFTFAPMLILVLLTHKRQRLGDMVARSVVVESTDPQTEPRP